MKKLFCILTCLALFAACEPSDSADTGKKNSDTGKKNSGTPSVIFGVMSDTHIGATSLSGLTPEARLRKA